MLFFQQFNQPFNHQPPYSSKSLWLPCKESLCKVWGTSQRGRKLCVRCIVPSMPSETLQGPVLTFWSDTYDCILPPSLHRPQRLYKPLRLPQMFGTVFDSQNRLVNSSPKDLLIFWDRDIIFFCNKQLSFLCQEKA